jgi:hypothetical protein
MGKRGPQFNNSFGSQIGLDLVERFGWGNYESLVVLERNFCGGKNLG